MAFLESLFGRPEQTKRVPLQDPQQQQVSSQLLEQLAPLMQQQLGGGDQFEPIAQQARQQFQEQTVPSIMERLGELGGGGRSGALGQQLGAAGAGLESQLASQKAQFGQQERGQNLALLQSLLQPQQQAFLQPGSKGILGEAAGTFGPTLGAAGLLGGASLLGGGGLGGLANLPQLLTGKRTQQSQPQQNMPLVGLLAALSQQGGR